MTAEPMRRLVADQFARVEIALLARVLATTLAGALPPAMLRVERRHSLADRLARRPAAVTGVSVITPRQTLTLIARDIGDVEATVSHVVGGVVLSRRTVPVADWIDALAAELDHLPADDQRTREALRRVLG